MKPDFIHDNLAATDPTLLVWVLILGGAYMIFRTLLKVSGSFVSKLPKSGTVGHDLVAYLLVSAAFNCYVAIVGTRLFLSEVALNLQRDGLYGESEVVKEKIVIPMLAYQLANFGICAFLKEYRTGAFIGHHLVTAALSYFAIAPYVHYYGSLFPGSS